MELCHQAIAEQTNYPEEFFEKVCSSFLYSDNFLRKQLQAKHCPINTSGGAQEKYDVPF